MGVNVPNQRLIAKSFATLSLEEIEKLLHSPIHEERLIALFILVGKFSKGDLNIRQSIYNLYLQNTKSINNWDLVDSSADKIIGAYLLDKDITLLKKLAKSDIIWERRIAIIATFQFIKVTKDFGPTLKIAEILVHDKEDLIHKAVGWMLREGGEKVSLDQEEEFLKKYYKSMPRTMLRYAIEKFPEEKRKNYLLGKILS